MAASMRVGLNKRLNDVKANEDSLVIIPFGFQINGTSAPDNVKGDLIDRTIVRNSAGNFTLTLRARPAKCLSGVAVVSHTSNVDIVGAVDWTAVETAGTFVVRCLTGTVETDPADNKFVGGHLICKRSSRARTGAT